MAQAICFIVENDGIHCDGLTGVPGTARGMCSKHYNRWRRYGDPLQTSVIVGNDEARFWSKVDKRGPEECWPWTATIDESGYGTLGVVIDGRPRMMHATRWLLGHLRGEPLASGTTREVACHHCDNPPCCNPAHLYIGTMKDNAADRENRGRSRQAKTTHCPQGHPYDADNTLIRQDGRRKCRECGREAGRKRQRAIEDCKNGHPLTGENLMITKGGRRKCRACLDALASANAERMSVVWAERRARREDAA